jgi:hypothetical protein
MGGERERERKRWGEREREREIESTQKGTYKQANNRSTGKT